MKRTKSAWLCGVVILSLSFDVLAVFSVLSGTMYGTEPTIHDLHGICLDDSDDNPYSADTTFTVSQSGQYRIASTQWSIGMDVWFGIYTGSFNPSNPAANRVAQQTRGAWDVDEPVVVSLQAGTTYRLAVSPWCSPERGVWVLAFTGPGQVNSSTRVNQLDSFLSGTLSAGGQTANIGCGSKPYRESGAQRVNKSGRYYYADVSYYFGLGLCVGIYTAPFNPSNPSANRLMLIDGLYFEWLDLEAGRNYYFVVQAASQQAQSGDYLFLITPGTDFYIDPVLSGGWFDPGTSGQGFFLDVLGHQRLIFLGWFTYDLQRPPGNVQAMMGDPGHRWLTAFGGFGPRSAALDLEVTTGGVFDSAAAVNQAVDGSLDVEFFDCNTGRITYDLGSGGASGVIDIQRISNINSRACQSLMRRSGRPRPLNSN